MSYPFYNTIPTTKSRPTICWN